jgi:hypothetical protein
MRREDRNKNRTAIEDAYAAMPTFDDYVALMGQGAPSTNLDSDSDLDSETSSQTGAHLAPPHVGLAGMDIGNDDFVSGNSDLEGSSSSASDDDSDEGYDDDVEAEEDVDDDEDL